MMNKVWIGEQAEEEETEPPEEEGMGVTKEEVKKEIDMSKKGLQDQIDMLKEKAGKKGGQDSPEEENMPIDPELKAMLEGIQGIVKTQGEAIGSLTQEREKGQRDEQLREKIQAETEPLKTEIGTVKEEVKTTRDLICDKNGLVCFRTKAELDEWQQKFTQEQDRKLEKLRAKGTGHPPEAIHGGDAGTIIECADCREPITEAVISRIKEDEEYRKRFIAEECKDKTCRTDLFNHLVETAEGEEKENLEKQKKFFLDKD